MAKLTRQEIYDTAKELSNWGRWGDDDQIGTLNNVTPEDIVAAAGLVKKGRSFALGLDLKEKIQSGLFGGRWNMIHQMLATGTDAVTGEQDGDGKAYLRYADDAINLPCQVGTQWDALCHIFLDDKMYNGYPATDVTVNGAKTNYETPLGEIPRFIIHGADDRNWKLATSFKGSGGLDGSGDLLNPKQADGEGTPGEPKEKLVKVTPAEGELVSDRQPLIEFDFSKLEGVESTSLEMRVGGFGKVPAKLDPDKKVFSWKVPRKLRNETCTVQVTLRQAGKQRRVAWEFSIDKLMLYTPQYVDKYPVEELEAAVPKAIPVGRPK